MSDLKTMIENGITATALALLQYQAMLNKRL